MHAQHRWAQAMTLVQIAISLAAITFLTRMRWLRWGAFATAIAGAGLRGERTAWGRFFCDNDDFGAVGHRKSCVPPTMLPSPG